MRRLESYHQMILIGLVCSSKPPPPEEWNASLCGRAVPFYVNVFDHHHPFPWGKYNIYLVLLVVFSSICRTAHIGIKSLGRGELDSLYHGISKQYRK